RSRTGAALRGARNPGTWADGWEVHREGATHRGRARISADGRRGRGPAKPCGIDEWTRRRSLGNGMSPYPGMAIFLPSQTSASTQELTHRTHDFGASCRYYHPMPHSPGTLRSVAIALALAGFVLGSNNCLLGAWTGASACMASVTTPAPASGAHACCQH